MKYVFFFILVTLYACTSQSQDSLQNIIKNRQIKGSDLEILIDKSDRTLSVLYHDTTLITYPCVLGFNPVDDKKQEGDGCTPEGTFKIRSKYPHKNWSYFIWIDYPNKKSWEKFNERRANGQIESSASIGGEIGIHGVPEGMDELIEQQVDWTLGCISLRSKDITDLYKSIGNNTSIVIRQ